MRFLEQKQIVQLQVALNEFKFSEDAADEAGGLILTSGSYKLGNSIVNDVDHAVFS